jgi:putative heme degradation protein
VARKPVRIQKAEVPDIPEFSSLEEEAEWFDTHDLSDLLKNSRLTNVQVAKEIGHTIVLDLDSDTLAALSEIARRRGTGVIALVKEWIQKGISQNTDD